MFTFLLWLLIFKFKKIKFVFPNHTLPSTIQIIFDTDNCFAFMIQMFSSSFYFIKFSYDPDTQHEFFLSLLLKGNCSSWKKMDIIDIASHFGNNWGTLLDCFNFLASKCYKDFVWGMNLNPNLYSVFIFKHAKFHTLRIRQF